ncbi:SDR family NAD(P)-dependent oxidoreductase [Pseudooceanicola aestuarii]|uniref:SDR family NAD(P)-dependent oxidoreductase n=1 Tax=Pseudooceanicola aestuarii TaxID=2697319 RepID=UPI0013CFE14E|nr:SDR family oxidoreductase [Pseudooceanicola aestuarii]
MSDSTLRPAILVIGAARGIGRAIAEALIPDHRVVITWHSAHAEAQALSARGVTCIRADFTDPDAPARVVAQAVAAVGPLSGLVNNAGAIAEGGIDGFDPKAAETVMRVNLMAPLALVAAALDQLAPGASVVNITSMNARFPAAGALAYSASKAALDNATIGLAKALGPRGIRVNAVAPGAVERDHAPRPAELQQKFLAEMALDHLPEDHQIASAVRYLLSPGAGAMTGAVLPVTGGFRL